MKQKTKQLISLALFFFGVILFLWNCTIEENIDQTNNIQLNTIETVSFEDAIAFFNSKKKEIEASKTNKKTNDEAFKVTPNWNTLAYNNVAYTDAKLTTADSEINREGEYLSQLYFINVNNHIKNVIFTFWKDKVDSEGNVINGRIFFNDLEGKFIDGYRIEEGVFTKRFVEATSIQNASFLPMFLFQTVPIDDKGCWNTDTLSLYEGGNLNEVVLTLGGGTGLEHSNINNWYYVASLGSLTYGDYINYATAYGPETATGGVNGGSINSLSNTQITSAAAAILMTTPIEPDENGNCPEGFQKNKSTGKCDPICTGGKVWNKVTKTCECPEGYVEDSNGNCIKKPCKGNPILGKLEIAPQKGKSGTLGAMFGNSTTGGCKRYGASDCTTPRNKKHDGIDIKSDYGDPIFAMYDGFIYSSKYDRDGAGYYTRIQSTINGVTIITSYFHLQKENRLLATNPLNHVKAGDIIGYQGDSGNLKNAIANGGVDSHVHIETRKHDGSNSWGYSHFNLVDPRDYFETKIDSTGVSQSNTNCN